MSSLHIIVYHRASFNAPFHLPFNPTAHPFLKSISKNSSPFAGAISACPHRAPERRHRPAKVLTQYVFTGGEKHFSGNNEVGANVEFLEMP
jgi:hypothetical protein